MILRYHNTYSAQPKILELRQDFIRIGRASTNDIVLNSPYVAEEAAWLRREGDNWFLQCVGGRNCKVDNELLPLQKSTQIDHDSIFSIHQYTFQVESLGGKSALPSGNSAWESSANELINRVHIELLDDRGMALAGMKEDDQALISLEQDIEKICGRYPEMQDRGFRVYLAGQMVRGRILYKLFSDHRRESIWENKKGDRWARPLSAVTEFERETRRILEKLEQQLELGSLPDISEKSRRVERDFWELWRDHSQDSLEQFLSYLARQEIIKQLKDMIFGYGPLEDLLRNPCIDEIMVINSRQIYVEKGGVVEDSGRHFVNDGVTLAIIERIVSLVDRQIDKSQPMVDARLRDGSRVNAVIAPIALSGPCLTIRKFPQKRLSISQLVREKKTLTRSAAEFLRIAVLNRANILIAGGTGTGKTTLLNCLSQFIPNKERIVTVEDTAELQLQKEHVVRMEAKLANSEGRGAYKIRDLVRNSLRMRPDRIVVGECRGPEALDMLQAMNTGHDGSMTTLHANSAADVLLRLEVLVLDAAQLPVSSIRQQIASAVDFIVQLNRLPDGRRVVSEIVELCGFDAKSEQILTKPIFRLEYEAANAELEPTGYLPTAIDEMIDAGLDLETLYPES
jgi:pilus assembly protein CpaF